jgi:hypothetical protein
MPEWVFAQFKVLRCGDQPDILESLRCEIGFESRLATEQIAQRVIVQHNRSIFGAAFRVPIGYDHSALANLDSHAGDGMVAAQIVETFDFSGASSYRAFSSSLY